ncbi:MAG: hypothetical protein KDB80_08220 [Planctomycetes bacterium]|nr:hypothetical protein [Planctomycetota bacterium]
MRCNTRFLVGFVAGPTLLLTAHARSLGQPEALISIPTFVLVVGTAILLAAATLGVASARRWLHAAFVELPPSEAERRELARVTDLLDRGAMLGAFAGMMLGAVELFEVMRDPLEIGPPIHVLVMAPVYAAMFSAFVCLPLRHQLTAPRIDADHRSLSGIGIAALLCAIPLVTFYWPRMLGSYREFPIGDLGLLASLVVPTFLATPARGAAHGLRNPIADALACAAVVGFGANILHVGSVLDQPGIMLAGVAHAALIAAIAAFSSGVVRLTATATDRVDTTSRHVRFAGVSIAAIAAALFVVYLVLDRVEFFQSETLR